MKCQFCMEEIADDSEKCSLCNSELVKPCPFCREKIQAGAMKCKHCGSMINAGTPQQQGQTPYQQPPQVQGQQPSVQSQQAQQSYSPPPQQKIKSQTIAAILCALLGGLGIHRFYLGPIWMGVVYLLLCWTGIPGLIALVETYIIAFSSQETWAKKYNNSVITPPAHIAVKILAAIFPIVFIVGILVAVAIPQFNAYRTKGFNSAAKSDIRNAKTVLEAHFADHQRYPEKLEAVDGKFQASKNVDVKCSINPTGYVCASAHKQGTIMYVANSTEANIEEQPYKSGNAVQAPYDPPMAGSAKADEYFQNSAPAGQVQPDATQQQANEQMTFTPSFDCAKASTGAERMICSNKDLAQADVQLAQVYKATLSKSSNKAAFKKEQGAWIRNQRDACSDAAALLQVYQDRISQLSR